MTISYFPCEKKESFGPKSDNTSWCQLVKGMITPTPSKLHSNSQRRNVSLKCFISNQIEQNKIERNQTLGSMVSTYVGRGSNPTIIVWGGDLMIDNPRDHHICESERYRFD